MASVPPPRPQPSPTTMASPEAAARAGDEPAAPGKKWLVTFAVMSGTFLAVMDVTVVNVALPHMMGNFGQTLSAITWVATSYSIAEMLMITMAGWWSAVLGRKRLYLASFALFTLGSILAGTAQTFPQMLVYRIIQGLGGGSLIPVSQAILRETFPPREQGMAMAVFGMGVVLAPALGPILGGWLTDTYGWPWIFYINLPVSLVGILMVSAFVQDPPYLRRGIARIDWVGIGLLMVSLTGMQIVLERGQEHHWFESNWIAAGASITVVAMLAFVLWELWVRDPIVDFRVLRNIPLSVGSGIGAIFGVAFFGTTFYLPAFTQRLLDYPAYQSGLVLLPRATTLFLLMPVVGWLINYVDPRLLIVIGIAMTYVSFQQLAQLSLAAGFWNLVPFMLLMGAGMPCLFVTLSTVSLRSVRREEMTSATSLYTLTRRVGGNLGYALVATLIERFTAVHRGHLVAHVSDFNPAFHGYQGALTNRLSSRMGDGVAAETTALALIDAEVTRQAAMLAYNDIAWIFAAMFLATLPFIFLFGRGEGRAASMAPKS